MFSKLRHSFIPAFLWFAAGCTSPATSPTASATESPIPGESPASESATAATPAVSVSAGPTATPPKDAADDLARAIVMEKTQVGYSPSAHAAAVMTCVEEEGAGSGCRLDELDISVAVSSAGAKGLELWDVGADPKKAGLAALEKVAERLRSKKYVPLSRIEWPSDKRELALPGGPTLELKGDGVAVPRAKGTPLVTELEKPSPPHKNRVLAAYTSKDHPVVVLEVQRDPGKAYGSYNASTYFRVLHVGPRISEPAPKPLGAEVQQGSSAWAVYLAWGKSTSEPAMKSSAQRATQEKLNPSVGELRCDAGAIEALGVSESLLAVRVYFSTEDAARRFAEQRTPRPLGIANVKTMCLD